MGSFWQNLATVVGAGKRSLYGPPTGLSGDPNSQENADWESSPYSPPTQNTNVVSTPTQQSSLYDAPPNAASSSAPARYQQVSQQLEDAYAPPKISTGKAILGAVVGGITKNPQIGGLITGQTQRERNIQALTGQQQTIAGEMQSQANVGNLQSEAALRSAQAAQIQNTIPITLANGQTIYLDRKDAAGLIGRQETAAGGVQKQQIASRFKAVPGLGLYDTQGNNGSGALIPGTQQGITVSPEIAQQYGLPQEFIGKPLSLSQLSSVENAQRFNEQPVEGANGPALVNRNPSSPGFGTVKDLGLGNPNMGHAVQVGDPNNPGNTIYTTAGNAVQKGLNGTSSASVQVPRQAEKAAVPTKIGDQQVAFNTMIQHANLLRQAASALGNGDNQTLAGLKNAFKNEFGYSGPITAQAIADAYNGEVTNVISKGHITDKEMEKTGKTIDPSKQNLQTINSVLGAYQALAQSKMNMLNNQTRNAVSATQPNAPSASIVDGLVNKYGGR